MRTNPVLKNEMLQDPISVSVEEMRKAKGKWWRHEEDLDENGLEKVKLD